MKGVAKPGKLGKLAVQGLLSAPQRSVSPSDSHFCHASRNSTPCPATLVHRHAWAGVRGFWTASLYVGCSGQGGMKGSLQSERSLVHARAERLALGDGIEAARARTVSIVPTSSESQDRGFLCWCFGKPNSVPTVRRRQSLPPRGRVGSLVRLACQPGAASVGVPYNRSLEWTSTSWPRYAQQLIIASRGQLVPAPQLQR